MCGTLILIFLCKYCFALNVTVWERTQYIDLPCGRAGGQYNFNWKKQDGHSYIQINDNEKFLFLTNYNLRIQNIECSDGGTYICENNKPSPEEPIYLQVKTYDRWFCWSEWTSCSARCEKTRSRVCSTSYCIGSPTEVTRCSSPCSTDGGWSVWSDWGMCSVTCGGGIRTRKRLCNNPLKQGTGSDCKGKDVDSEDCEMAGCGEWTDWNTWTAGCPTNCGEAYKVRSRVCRYLQQIRTNCDGYPDEYELCTVSTCPVMVGGTLTITCKFSGTVWWYKNRQNIIQSVNFTKTNVGYDDAGIYFCYSNNNSGNNTTISVQGKPDIMMPKPSYSVSVGGSVILQCDVVSYPELRRLWWTKDSAQIDLRENKYTGGTLNNPSLHIQEINERDQGTYYCHAENSMGQSIGKTKVTTGYTPFVDILKDYYVTMTNQSITIDVVIRNANGATLQWYKDDQYISVWSDARYTGGTFDTPSLVIKNVQSIDKGKYTCEVNSSNFGLNKDSTTLKVVHTTVNQTVYSKHLNKTVTLRCDKLDALEVNWFHNEVKIVPEMDKYTGGVLETPSLTIRNLIHKDRGIYICETSYDGIKSRSGDITLHILDKPFFESSQEYVPVTAGGDVILPCTFYSYSSVKEVFWHKDGERIILNTIKYNGSTTTQPSLTIYNLGMADSGRYSCFVTNDQGKSSSNIIELQITDGEESSYVTVAVLASIVGILAIIVLIIIGLIVMKKRRSVNSNEYRRSLVNTAVVYSRPGHLDVMYANVAIHSNHSITDNEETTPIVTQSEDENNSYYNIKDIATSVKIDDIKAYIARKQSNNDLIKEFKSIPNGEQHPTTIGKKEKNISKNRFKTTFPYDHSRVILELSGEEKSDYVNANYIGGFEKEKRYIASQGPMKSTLADHWRMVWQNNTKKIVMLTNLIEGGRIKCDRYWPVGGTKMDVGNLVITLTSEKERAAYITRELEIENKMTKEKRSVIQYHFTSWPDHGTPDPLYLVLFHKHVRTDHYQMEDGTILVHCSAGIGRTGTYIALDALFEEGQKTGCIDILTFVKSMRNSRINMIQTQDQYVFLHFALLEAFTMKDTVIAKDRFSEVWQDIQSDKRPLNQHKLFEEYKLLLARKSENADYCYSIAKSADNVNKNRDHNVLPMDNTRVFLTSYQKGRSDYINAVQVPSYTRFIGYITTQIPLPDTKIDFWTMIRDHNSSTIVLILNDLKEADMVYTVSTDTFTCGPFNVKVTQQEKGEHDITQAKLIIHRKDDKAREVALFQIVCRDLPDAKDLCRLIDLIFTRISMSNDPVTVVSGDGAKNCGLFCTFANAVSSMKIDEKADIFQLARLLLLRRHEFFKHFEEYRLCYEALHVYLESANVYANY